MLTTPKSNTMEVRADATRRVALLVSESSKAENIKEEDESREGAKPLIRPCEMLFEQEASGDPEPAGTGSLELVPPSASISHKPNKPDRSLRTVKDDEGDKTLDCLSPQFKTIDFPLNRGPMALSHP